MTTTPPRQQHGQPDTVEELLTVLEARPSLAVEADLQVAVNGHTMTVTGYDDLVALDLPSLPAVLSLWRDAPAEMEAGHAALAAVGLTVEIRVRGAPVARIGDAAVPSRVARLLGVGPVELVPDGALLAVLTRRRG